MSQPATLQITPGKGLGGFLLGGSLHDILALVKAQPSFYPSLDLLYSPSNPVAKPIVLALPKNGINLTFDGPDQRLRLIEVSNFSQASLTYKGSELVKPLPENPAAGPPFRHIYHKLFGPTVAGEYFPPSGQGSPKDGTYILSYPGVAFSFNIPHSSWSPSTDFVSLLSAPTTSVTRCMTTFNGPSWKEARQDYLSRTCPHPRSLSLTGRNRDSEVDEVEMIKVLGDRRVEIQQRSHATCRIVLNETTPQDLISQLGPPDAIYRKYDRKLSIHKHRSSSRPDHPPFMAGSPPGFEEYSDTDRSSNAATDYSSPDEDATNPLGPYASPECFYNYFNHGFDVFLSYPSEATNAAGAGGGSDSQAQSIANAGQLVATKLILHGNVPGSYMFNRYRRSRWKLYLNLDASPDSEAPFSQVAGDLRPLWDSAYIDGAQVKSMMTPMVLNRDWGDSPTSSYEFADLKASSEHTDLEERSDPRLGTTRLFGYPGFLFEVLRNDAVSCLTVY